MQATWTQLVSVVFFLEVPLTRFKSSITIFRFFVFLLSCSSAFSLLYLLVLLPSRSLTFSFTDLLNLSGQACYTPSASSLVLSIQRTERIFSQLCSLLFVHNLVKYIRDHFLKSVGMEVDRGITIGRIEGDLAQLK